VHTRLVAMNPEWAARLQASLKRAQAMKASVGNEKRHR